MDDQALQKLHQDAIEGKMRHKRRAGGLNVDDDSSDEDEDEQAKRIRRKIAKKRKIDGDNLEELGECYSYIRFDCRSPSSYQVLMRKPSLSTIRIRAVLKTIMRSLLT